MTYDIIVVDDEGDIRNLVSDILKDEGYQVRLAGNKQTALELLKSSKPDLAILDVWLKDSPKDGLDLLQEALLEYPGLPVLMMSGHGTIETAVQAIKMGAYDFLEKPFTSEKLLLLAKHAIENAKLKQENNELKKKLPASIELIGKSSSIVQINQQIQKIASSSSRVFISGASGVGKETVAKQIHALSSRKNGPFVTVNCSCLNANDFEEKLFGTDPTPSTPNYETSSANENNINRTVGLLEQAHNGTLFLDELADLSKEMQAKLVRVLHEQSFVRFGSQRKININIRFIAASSCDIQKEIAAGNFREDLYYRLNVASLKIPSLKDRPEDIPFLTQHFVTDIAQNLKFTPPPIGEDVISALQAYQWPGNVRQLRNVIEWMLIMMPDDHEGALHIDALPPEIFVNAPAILHMNKSDEMMGLPLREAREAFERQYLLAQVSKFSGNISQTASFIGMERSALHRKLRALGVNSQKKAS